MRRSRKIILIALLAVVVLAGSIGGIALANTEDEDNSQPGARHEAMLNRVCEIYEDNTGVAIDSQELQNAFTQARSEIMTEARDNFRQRLIDEGKVTEEQLDEFDAWMEARPDTPFPFGPRNGADIKPFGGGHHSFGKFGGGFRGWCEPSAPAE